MTLPINFLYLGGDKCGSTWLYHILSQHPQVTLAYAKELFFFDRFYDKGAAWYIRQFPANAKTRRVGEICHDYLYSKIALQRIAEDMPSDSRFLITVRNPIERAVSHYKYLRKIGSTSLLFEHAVVKHPQILEHSMFGKYVKISQETLGAERVIVLPFELLKTDAIQYGKAVSDALTISFLKELPYSDRILESQSARNATLVRWLRNAGWALRHLGAPRVVSAVKSLPIMGKLLYTSQKDGEKVEISPSLQAELKDHFAADQILLDKCVPNLQKR